MAAFPPESDVGREDLSSADDAGAQDLGTPSPSHALKELEAALDEARSELAQYQSLLQNLPSIYEEKFRQQVRSTSLDIRQLLDERKALQERLARTLSKPPEPQRLPPVVAEMPAEPLPRRRFEVALPSFLTSLKPDPSLVPSGNSTGFGFRLSRLWRLAFVVGFVLVVSVLVSQAVFRSQLRTGAVLPVPGKRVALPAAPTLKLLARGGQSWVLIEDLKGRKLLDLVLGNGEMRMVEIGDGLRIRSGRADLLYIGIGSQPLKRLGGVSDLDWAEVRP